MRLQQKPPKKAASKEHRNKTEVIGNQKTALFSSKKHHQKDPALQKTPKKQTENHLKSIGFNRFSHVFTHSSHLSECSPPLKPALPPNVAPAGIDRPRGVAAAAPLARLREPERKFNKLPSKASSGFLGRLHFGVSFRVFQTFFWVF